MPGQRIRELIAPLGYAGGKTILDDYLREVRPLFDPPRTFQRTIYRPGEICQFDLWEPRAEIPVGHGQTRRGWVVVACLGYSRAGAGALVFSKEIPDLLAGIRRCLWSLGALPQTLVWDRQSGPARRRWTSDRRLRRLLRRLEGRLVLLRAAADPQAKGAVERLQDFIERSFEPGRRFANELDFQAQLDTWFDERANPRMHKTLRCRPIDRLVEERAGDGAAAARSRPTPIGAGCCASRRIPTCASTPATTASTRALVGRRVEARVTEREVLAVALDTGELACRHAAVVRATSDDHRARARPHAQAQRAERRDGREPVVEVRSLAAYDALIA